MTSRLSRCTKGRVITKAIGDACKTSKSHFWSFLLFKLIREFKPSTCLELGTALGISACYQAAALKLNQAGNLTTLEGADSLALLAKQHFQALGLDNVRVVIGRFQDTLDEVLNRQQPIDYAFIDGHHDEKATLDYFEQLAPFLSERAMLIFDDISWSEGMKRGWSAMEADSRVRISIDLETVGICIINNCMKRKQSCKIPLQRRSRIVTL